MMLDYTMFLSLFTLASCAAMVTDIKAELGESPSFSCSLPNAAGVKQVTWQRLGHDDSVHTLATFSENFKHQLADPYLGKVDVTLATLNATTIVIKNVTFADEGCYVCTFNVYPSGTERKKTCLTVQGLSEITTSFFHEPTKKEVVVSCSATGKPAPVVSWKFTDKELIGNATVIDNDDGSSTATNNLTLVLSPGKNVECVAQSGIIQRSQHIAMNHNQTLHVPGPPPRHYVGLFVVIICVVSAICIVVVLQRKRAKECGKGRTLLV